jgi:glutathione peroxidase-family protein
MPSTSRRPLHEKDSAMSDFYAITMPSITGEEVSFERFRDQVTLVVNVASA